jgi:hypothetical protein
VEDNIEELLLGFRALIMAEIGKWRDYDPKLNSGVLDSFSSAVAGHRDRYRSKLEQLKFSCAKDRKQLDLIEKDVIRFANRVISDAISRGKIEYEEEKRIADQCQRPFSIMARKLGVSQGEKTPQVIVKGKHGVPKRATPEQRIDLLRKAWRSGHAGKFELLPQLRALRSETGELSVHEIINKLILEIKKNG